MAPADYAYLSELLQRESGLCLGPHKEYLLESRLTPLARTRGLGGLSGLVRRLRERGDDELSRAVCEAMTTNESLFFRDATPFRLLQEELLPELAARRVATRRLRIWCAAGSTGQEPYSLAMILDEMAALFYGWRVEILSTDYSRAALDRARAGLYNHFEVQRGLPIQMLTRHFHRVGDDWQISESLRRAVQFRELNLLEPFQHLGRFDVVLCRNVLIYFDLPTKAEVLARLAGCVADDGYLFLGGSETAMGVTRHFDRVPGAGTSVYRVADGGWRIAV
ncbi:MAG TPA: CheR family methyltransferase [Longimicrobiaceae bacterium]|nr:CheR family methyltransferase [Longimicrobiaceae bacterium]